MVPLRAIRCGFSLNHAWLSQELPIFLLYFAQLRLVISSLTMSMYDRALPELSSGCLQVELSVAWSQHPDKEKHESHGHVLRPVSSQVS